MARSTLVSTAVVVWVAASTAFGCVVSPTAALLPALASGTATVDAPLHARAPNPLRRISLLTGAVASSGDPSGAVGGDPSKIWSPASAAGEWLAIPLQAPAPATLVFTWNAAGFKYLNLEAAPRTYALSVSADSTDGRNGTWRSVLRVTDNPVRARAETLHAPGARWLKWTVESAWEGKLALRDLAVYGTAATAGLDVWHVCGDSISDGAFNAVATRDFVSTVSLALPAHTPVVIDGATPSDNARMGIERLRTGLAVTPPGGYVALAFGTNDTAQGVPLETYRAQMQQLVDMVKASGRTPMIARIPWFPNPKVTDYLAVVDALTAANKLPAGPDLYTWFKTHPEELGSDQIHPNAVGRRSVQRLWGEAAVRAYRGS
jgi:lysophospholipase L1-like esterase